MIPPVAMSSAAFRSGWLLMLAATLNAMGLRIEPHAPPKYVYFLGPTAGYGVMLGYGSMNENIVLVALTPFPPAFNVEAVIYSVMVEFGESLTKTGFL